MFTSYPLRLRYYNGNGHCNRASLIIHHLVMIFCICSHTFIIPLSVVEARGSTSSLNEVFDDNNSRRQNDGIISRRISIIKSNSVKNRYRHAQTDNGQIIGGTIVPPGKYPFFAQLDCCGATLIHHDIVLTAAHCDCVVANKSIVQLNVTKISAGGDPHLVERVIVYPTYNPGTYLNDIQILKLSCSSKVKPIALNFKKRLPGAGSDVTVIGTGLREIFEYPDDVYETSLEIVTNRICSTLLKKAFNGTYTASQWHCDGLCNMIRT